MSINIQTERLILREFTKEDTVDLHEICSETYILKWMPDWEVPFEIREKWIEWVRSKYITSTRENIRMMLGIVLKESGKLIGMVGVGNKEEVNNEIEIAYFITEKMSGKGYVSEAVQAMSKWIFKTFDIDYLIAIVELDNYSSQRVVEKCGFTKIGKRMILNSGESEEKPFYYYKLLNNRKQIM
ncbi:Protein N-acetyltransferase, RimJ/RimL family [Maledivibacter halophilus]|uniref:Protein N-acetyltransferase, RimJ/RimL family n=2 Tax=Maledivibacter halophilus TaxID=36842 RepID=A0A1T5KQN1_9FIRM|nr:Protein N-acetyltransferase, RimJ/RimL family [Maledivibacter halophilus]